MRPSWSTQLSLPEFTASLAISMIRSLLERLGAIIQCLGDWIGQLAFVPSFASKMS